MQGRHGQVLVFDGTLEVASFTAFCAHRAARLSLEHRVVSASGRRFEVALAGHETLIDMFEMACSLGPADCVVLNVSRVAR